MTIWTEEAFTVNILVRIRLRIEPLNLKSQPRAVYLSRRPEGASLKLQSNINLEGSGISRLYKPLLL